MAATNIPSAFMQLSTPFIASQIPLASRQLLRTHLGLSSLVAGGFDP
jgi:hypothetical protein